MEPLTSFQEKKILRVFNMLYDMDGDGYIDKKDFDELLRIISVTLNWDADNEKYKAAVETLESVWTGLLKIADLDHDARITSKEWLKMWGNCLADLENGGKFPEWQENYMRLMFNVNDKSGDEHIDSDEYTTFFSQFNISEDECRDAFQRISGGRKITREMFETLWKEYLTSNDEQSKGNFLFGILK